MVDPKPILAIEVVEYDPQWAEEFQSYAVKIKAVLGHLAMSVEHVGSTSVPGLAAKPIIDIDIVISSRLLLQAVIEKLTEIDYVHEGNLGIPGREAFMWPNGKRHHLYVCSVNTPNLHNHLIFRDYLRTHPEAVKAYGELKIDLAKQYRHDMKAYGVAKTAFIQKIISKADDDYGFDTFQPNLDDD